MNMHSYLEIVSEQIRCRRAKQMIQEELEGHIEDQKLDYMADGMNADEAEEEAVRQMGDPVETGMELDRIHRPRMDWKLVAAIVVLSLAGLFLQWMTYRQPDSAYKAAEVWRQGKYMALGVLMMAGICLADYTLIGKYAFRFWISAIGINAGCKLLACAKPGRFFLNGVSWFWTTSWFWGSLILPAYAAVVWRSGREGKKGFFKSVACLGVSAVVWRAVPGSGFVAAVFTLIGAVLLLAAVGKGWFGKEVRSLTMRAGIALAAVFLLVCAVSYGSAYLEQQTGYQAGSGQNVYGISYEEVREDMKELALSDREGEDLTGTELEWSRFDARSTFLWMYMLRYLGSLPVIVLTLLVGVFLTLLIRTVLGQRNRLGFLLGLAAVLFLSVQVVWYIGMNAGIFPVTEAYMPFYTQGGANLCVTYFYAGILLSIYRNSSVVKNER